jgi:hypothetical protein
MLLRSLRTTTILTSLSGRYVLEDVLNSSGGDETMA